MIEAEFSKDPQRGYVHANGEHVFRCDGERLNVKDTSGLPHATIQAFLVNAEATFGCVFPTSGVFTCYRFTPAVDLMATLMTGQECLKGQLEKTIAAKITPGALAFGAPR